MTASASLDLPLDLPDALAPEAAPAVRAVWQTLYAQNHPDLNFEQAMSIPFLRRGIINSAEYRQRNLARRRITPHKGDA